MSQLKVGHTFMLPLPGVVYEIVPPQLLVVLQGMSAPGVVCEVLSLNPNSVPQT